MTVVQSSPKTAVTATTTSDLWRHVAGAPFIYGLAIPFAALDAAVSLYQAACFRLWRLPQVQRSQFVTLSRHELTYLNLIQRFNCAYCSYANGVIAYVSEIASRTEQYWCPIKQAQDPPSPHDRYADFISYGDARNVTARVDAFREDLRRKSEGASSRTSQ